MNRKDDTSLDSFGVGSLGETGSIVFHYQGYICRIEMGKNTRNMMIIKGGCEKI